MGEEKVDGLSRRLIRIHFDINQQYCAWDPVNDYEGWGNSVEEAVGVLVMARKEDYGLEFSGLTPTRPDLVEDDEED